MNDCKLDNVYAARKSNQTKLVITVMEIAEAQANFLLRLPQLALPIR